jgi:hypothetical protein
MARQQIHKEWIRPELGQAVAAEHVGREVLDIVRDAKGGLGGDRRSDDASLRWPAVAGTLFEAAI